VAAARVELAKVRAGEDLRRELSQLRAARGEGEDEYHYFQLPLQVAHADYVRKVFCAELDAEIAEGSQNPRSGTQLGHAINEIAQVLVANTVLVWRDSGGDPQYKDDFVERAFKTIKVSQCYQDAIGKIASGYDGRPSMDSPEEMGASTDSVVLARSQPSELAHRGDTHSPSVDAGVVAEKRVRAAARKPGRPHSRYQKIDEALRRIADSQPKTQSEIFKGLDEAKIAVPNSEPFHSARNWSLGYRNNRHRASSWLSTRWRVLALEPLPRGPKKSA
jgi:hypothetical protein